jgi:hypothetical protein
MKLGIGIVALLVTTFACSPTPPPPPHSIVECAPVDAGPDDGLLDFDADQSPEALARTSPCARACASLSLLKCPESKQRPKGMTCIEACTKLAKISSFDPECIALAKTVAAVRKCPQLTCAQ